MTVYELITRLQTYPADMVVWRYEDQHITKIERVVMSNISLSENNENGYEVLNGKDTGVILD